MPEFENIDNPRQNGNATPYAGNKNQTIEFRPDRKRYQKKSPSSHNELPPLSQKRKSNIKEHERNLQKPRPLPKKKGKKNIWEHFKLWLLTLIGKSPKKKSNQRRENKNRRRNQQQKRNAHSSQRKKNNKRSNKKHSSEKKSKKAYKGPQNKQQNSKIGTQHSQNRKKGSKQQSSKRQRNNKSSQ